MAKNTRMLNAKISQFDEYFTEYRAIANEIPHYREHLKNKVIYMNCDDPFSSNFWRYFHNNFTSLGLKKIISTHFVKNSEPSYMLEYDGGDDFNMDAGKINPIYGDELYTAGDFRSKDCIGLLNKADIVITNPPFSLFREFLEQLLDHNKEFIVIGNMSAINNKDFFPLLKDNQLWTGYKPYSGGMDMIVPEKDFDPNKVKKYTINGAGQYIVNVEGVIWYTNIDTQKRKDGFWHKNGVFDMEISHKYYEGNESYYLNYDNFDGIDVRQLSDIPIDYTGKMGVPITFFEKYNPDEFELIGIGSGKSAASIGVTKNYRGRTDIAYTLPDGTQKCPFSRLIVKNKNPIKKSDDKGF